MPTGYAGDASVPTPLRVLSRPYDSGEILTRGTSVTNVHFRAQIVHNGDTPCGYVKQAIVLKRPGQLIRIAGLHQVLSLRLPQHPLHPRHTRSDLLDRKMHPSMMEADHLKP